MVSVLKMESTQKIEMMPQSITVIGGGAGSKTVVRAFSQPPFTGEGVTAIATTFDDDGGTGEKSSDRLKVQGRKLGKGRQR